MPSADVLIVRSYPQRKAAVLRATQLLMPSLGADGEREFEQIIEAIADFDIRQNALDYIEIPRAFAVLLSNRHRDGPSAGQR